mmetsp:Transcript_27779/g.70259  ORF Transcript_27779/g.70259 Transcript_27779/m.70259 type:complete len:97 (-) Transcript_27779:237-527(-)
MLDPGGTVALEPMGTGMGGSSSGTHTHRPVYPGRGGGGGEHEYPRECGAGGGELSRRSGVDSDRCCTGAKASCTVFVGTAVAVIAVGTAAAVAVTV